MVMVPTGPENKNDCAGEGQYQITALSKLLKNLQITYVILYLLIKLRGLARQRTIPTERPPLVG
jgi:hypothetical protein